MPLRLRLPPRTTARPRSCYKVVACNQRGPHDW